LTRWATSGRCATRATSGTSADDPRAPGHKHLCIAIDSNVLIYLLEGSGPLADKSAALLDAIAAGEASGVLASLCLTEVCSGPARAGDRALVERYADELTSLENVRIVPLDADVAVDAAVIRGATA
jgi:predicted nucleic acid-binding protein